MVEKKIYWDTNCFLGWLKKEPDKYSDCRDVLKAAEKEEVTIFTSAWALTEVLYKYKRDDARSNNKHRKEIENFFEKFLNNGFIKMANVTRVTSELARTCYWEYGFSPPDCVHVASAIELEIPIFNTFDNGILSFGEIDFQDPKPLKRKLKMKFEKPKYTTQQGLNLEDDKNKPVKNGGNDNEQNGPGQKED